MNCVSVTAENHMFKVETLNSAKAGKVRPHFAGRRLLTQAGVLVLDVDVPGGLLDDLRRFGIGPQQIVFKPDPYKYIAGSALADVARRGHGIDTFWFGQPEHDLHQELGISVSMTPDRMEKINSKVGLRRIAEQLGWVWAVPHNVICRTRDEIDLAKRQIMRVVRPGDVFPDCAMGKISDGLSGAGMTFFITEEDVDLFWKDRNGSNTEFIVEAAWINRPSVVCSVHWDILETCRRVGASVNLIKDKRFHCGNIVSAGSKDLPGMTVNEVDHLYRMTTPFVRRHWMSGYRGRIGFDCIRVEDSNGNRRWYLLEANVHRPPAPRYAMALGETLAPRLGGEWAIAMAEVYPKDGAALGYDHLKCQLSRSPWGDLNFDGATGVLILLPALLPGMFLAVCVQRTTAGATELLERVRCMVGDMGI